MVDKLYPTIEQTRVEILGLGLGLGRLLALLWRYSVLFAIAPHP